MYAILRGVVDFAEEDCGEHGFSLAKNSRVRAGVVFDLSPSSLFHGNPSVVELRIGPALDYRSSCSPVGGETVSASITSS